MATSTPGPRDDTQTTHRRAATVRPYRGELEGHLYAAASRKPGYQHASGWLCAVCQQAPASVLDHCHEHGYVRAPVCPSCNTRERPEFLYPTDVLVGSRYESLFGTHAQDWLRHWHRCLGCRTRTTLPLPHLAALTAHLAAAKLRPTHRSPGSARGRKPCGGAARVLDRLPERARIVRDQRGRGLLPQRGAPDPGARLLR